MMLWRNTSTIVGTFVIDANTSAIDFENTYHVPSNTECIS
jgi:hypothetical protein